MYALLLYMSRRTCRYCAHHGGSCSVGVCCGVQGIPPAALSKVSSQSLRDFVTLCINPNPVKRPSALDLLKHEFFDSLKLGECADDQCWACMA